MAAITLILFREVLGPGRMIFASDQLVAGYMFKTFVVDSIRQGMGFPFWNPYIFGGLPVVDAMHGDVFFYTFFLRLLLPVHLVMSYVFVIHVFLAGLFMYLFVRELALGERAAVLSAFSYMLTGSLVSYVYSGHDGKMVVTSLIPLIFFLVSRGTRLRSMLYFIIAGGVVGLALISPNVQMTYYLLMAAGFYFIFELVRDRKGRKIAGVVIPCLGYGIMVTVGFSLAMIQILPALGYIPDSPRAGEGRGYEFATSWSMPPEEVFDCITPYFSGITERYWGRNYFKLHTEYMGIIPLLLAGVAIFGRWRDRRMRFFLGFGLFCLLMAFGGYTVFYKLAYVLIPGIKKFRAPGMIFFLVAFSTSVLAALGFRTLEEMREARRSPRGLWVGLITISVLAVLAFLIVAANTNGVIAFMKARFGPDLIELYGTGTAQEKLRAMENNYPAFRDGMAKAMVFALLGSIVLLLSTRRINPGWIALMLGILIVADLMPVDSHFITSVPPPERLYAADDIVQVLKRAPGKFRVFPLFHRNDDYLMQHGIESAGGYHGNQLRRYQEFIGAPETIMFSNPEHFLYKNFVDMANITYIIVPPLPDDLSMFDPLTRQTVAVTKQFLAQPSLRKVFSGREYDIWQNIRALPRAYVVHRWEVIADDERILERMKEESFDPHLEAIVERDLPLAPTAVETPENVTIQRYTPNRVVVEVNLETPGLLVLTDNYYKAWKANIDGVQTELYRTNYTFRGVPVPAGRHTVEFVYSSTSLKLGRFVTLVTLVFLVGALVVFVRRRATGGTL
jgi:hypothetical protein